MADADSGQSREGGQHRAERDDLCAVACAVGLAFSPPVVGVPRALPVRDIPARSPSVVMIGQARSHGSGSYRVDAHDPVAGGRDSTAVVVLTIALA